jgi:hypothetical protein
MRKITILTAILLLCSISSFATDTDRWRISVLAAEISTEKRMFAGSDAWADDAHAGVALGVAYAPSPQWDVELTIASQTHRSPYTMFFLAPAPEGQPSFVYPVTEFRQYRVLPIDVSVTRHFLTDQPIAPYVRAGVRHVAKPDAPTPSMITHFAGPIINDLDPVESGFGFEDRLSAQAGAGVRVRLTPRTAFRVEATRLLRSDRIDFDPLMRYAAGLSWMF